MKQTQSDESRIKGELFWILLLREKVQKVVGDITKKETKIDNNTGLRHYKIELSVCFFVAKGDRIELRDENRKELYRFKSYISLLSTTRILSVLGDDMSIGTFVRRTQTNLVREKSGSN